MCRHASDKNGIVSASKCTKNRLAAGLRPNPLKKLTAIMLTNFLGHTPGGTDARTHGRTTGKHNAPGTPNCGGDIKRFDI